MMNFIVLGLVPGTNWQFSLLILMLAVVFSAGISIIYLAWVHKFVQAKYPSVKKALTNATNHLFDQVKYFLHKDVVPRV